MIKFPFSTRRKKVKLLYPVASFISQSIWNLCDFPTRDYKTSTFFPLPKVQSVICIGFLTL